MRLTFTPEYSHVDMIYGSHIALCMQLGRMSQAAVPDNMRCHRHSVSQPAQAHRQLHQLLPLAPPALRFNAAPSNVKLCLAGDPSKAQRPQQQVGGSCTQFGKYRVLEIPLVHET